jgi:trigger factor
VVDIWPEIAVQGYEGAALTETVVEVDDELVDQFLEALRERHAETNPVVRASQKGDVVETSIIAVDVNGARLPRAKRQTVRMEAGGDSLLPEFREVSVGLQSGEERMVHITYPEEFGDRELAGKQRHYRMHVRQVMEKKLPDLDDAFAGRIDGMDSLEALRARIRLRMEAEERLRARQRTEESLVDLLIGRNAFDVPEGIIERSLRGALEKARKEDPEVDEEEFRRIYAPIVVRGEPIGTLKLQDVNLDRTWSAHDRALLEAVANEIAVAIDNARLLEQAERNARREQLISEISRKMLAASDMQSIIQIAGDELGQALRVARTDVSIGLAAPDRSVNPPGSANGDGG